MTTVEWFALAMVLAFATGVVVVTLAFVLWSDYWKNNRP